MAYNTSDSSKYEVFGDESDDDEFEELVVVLLAAEYQSTYFTKEPCRNSALTGHEYVIEVLRGHRDRCYDSFRMDQGVFLQFCGLLKDKGLLRDSRFLSVEEQVGIFLLTISHNERNRIIAERFQHSGETISRHFKKFLKAINRLGKELIVPLNLNNTPPEIRHNPRFYPFFENCIGAIDGTHIDAYVPLNQQIPYRGKKVVPTQNVMCACSFDMRFTYVMAGWEGTANDSRVFLECVTNPENEFPLPPRGKYYLVDSGYTNMPGFLSPFRGERYHLRDYRGRGRHPQDASELFNYTHSSLRNGNHYLASGSKRLGNMTWVPSTEQMADPFDIRFRTTHHRNRWAYHGAWYAENNPDFKKLSKDDALADRLKVELVKSGLMAELLVAFPDTRDFGNNLKFLIHEYLKHGGDLGIVDYMPKCHAPYITSITPSKGTFKACDVQNALKVAYNGKEVGIECAKGEYGQYYLYQVAIGIDDELNLVDSDMNKIMGGCESDDPIIYESYDINGNLITKKKRPINFWMS